jgi:signal transduction histidine kinase
MATSTPLASRFEPKPWSRSLDVFVLAALVAALLAAIVTLSEPSFATFGRWLLILECIALAGVTCGTAVSQIPRLRRYRPVVAHFLVSMVAVPVGYVIGSTFAYAVLGERAPILTQGPRPVIALVATGLAAVFIVYLDSMRTRVAQEAAARAEAQRLAVESQLRLLRAQLEPHMLFNTLANLRSLVELDSQMAQKMIDQLIVYLRSALAASREESTTLRAEFAQLRAYLEIMALRMGPRLTYRLELPDSLQRAAIPPMLLQPLVENAIKHGVEPQIGKGMIEIEARLKDDGIEIAVTDSGLGLLSEDEPSDSREEATMTATPRARAGTGTGYGLVHVRERLRAFYGGRASLTLTPHQPHGVRALVRIPQ